MPYKDLREFLDFLEEKGELMTCSREVDTKVEIAKVTDKSSKTGGPAILFVGTGHSGQLSLDEASRKYLSDRKIELTALPTPEIVDVYNQSNQRKAALIHVTC